MIKIGNIVNYDNARFDLDCFKVVSSYDDIDKSLPTLLLGFSKTKKEFGELDFFDKKIDTNLFWTFSRAEDRYNYNKDLGVFIDYCEAKLTDGFDYLFINPFELKLSQMKRFMSHVKQHSGYFLRDENMVYLRIKGITYGFNVELSNLYNIDNNHIFSYLRNNGYQELPKSVLTTFQEEFIGLEYDLSELLFLKEKFAI